MREWRHLWLPTFGFIEIGGNAAENKVVILSGDRPHSKAPLTLAVIVSLILYFTLISCASKKGSLFSAALELGIDRIYLSGSNSATGTSYAVTVYDTNGNFLGVLADYGSALEYPRGLAVFDSYNLLAAVEGSDRIDKISIYGIRSNFIQNAGLTGNIFDARKDAFNNIYVVEGNTIERFNSDGDRFPATGNAYINTTVGACTLSTPHGVTVNSDGYLLAVNSGNHRVTTFNVSSGTASCVATTTYGTSQPWDVVWNQTVGYAYMVTQGDDSIYRLNSDGSGGTSLYTYSPNTTNPSAIAALPNGYLLVATQGNDSIDLFDSSGNLLVSSFIRNSYTIDVSDILVVRGQ